MPLVNTHEASKITGIKEQSLRKGRTKNSGGLQTPPFIKENGKVLYDEQYLANWIKYVYRQGKRISR